MSVFIGIDNGVSGAVSVISPTLVDITPTPVRKVLNYTKTKAWFNRLDVPEMLLLLERYTTGYTTQQVMVMLERPMLNPGRFKASISALRCLEATLICLEKAGLPYEYIDSKEWQKALLPSGLEGDELKAASLDIGKRKFPALASKFKKDADSMMIALYLKNRETRTL